MMETLILKDRVSQDLSLRNMVSNIFKAVEFQKNEDVLIDFADIQSISRSFAHEYLIHKQQQNCKVLEINMPSNIKKMFEIVQDTKVKSEIIQNSIPQEIGLA